MILILDTNILLEERDWDCWALIKLLFELHPTYVQLGFDAEGLIEQEYKTKKKEMSDVNQELVEKLILNSIANFPTRFAPKASSPFAQAQLDELADMNCHPIEPVLLATSLADTEPALVYLESEREVIRRQYWRQPTLNELKKKERIGKCISTKDAARKLLRWHSRYPATPAALNALV